MRRPQELPVRQHYPAALGVTLEELRWSRHGDGCPGSHLSTDDACRLADGHVDVVKCVHLATRARGGVDARRTALPDQRMP